jgi:hypothetical protein
MRLGRVLFGAAVAAAIAGAAAAADIATAIVRLAETDVKIWINHPTIVDAVRAQNDQTGRLSAQEIAGLDRKWRSESISQSKPTIQALMANALSSFLMQKKRNSNGLYTEIFVMDGKGLNVGLTDVTSDYWQGDEDKWLKTFPAGPAAMHVGPVLRDKSTNLLQSQLSLPIVDPATGAVIGAITVGIDLAKLPR